MVTELSLIKRYRLAAGIGATVFLLLVVVATIREDRRSAWKEYQEAYRDTLVSKASSSLQTQAAAEYPVEIRQITLTPLQRTDRCVSCHVGIEDSRMGSLPLPFRSHGGSLLASHPPERYGCTLCHGGIGQSLDRSESCGGEHPDRLHVPFVRPPDIESACGRCHLAIFDTTVTSMPVLKRGTAVLRREGCLGCHRVRGKGGSVGPDLTNEGSRNQRTFDFSRVEGPQTISNWMLRHFRDPSAVSPGSLMPAFPLPDEELKALVTTVRGLFGPTIPAEYLTLAVMNELRGVSAPFNGEDAYAVFCSACHERNGKGREFQTTGFGVPSLAAEDFQAVASDDYVLFTLYEGRGGRMMASWAQRVSGLSVQELRNVARRLRKWRSPFPVPAQVLRAPASASEGGDVYRQHCATCHGPGGEGAAAKGINNPDFLSAASDAFLLETITRGRPNTAMPSWSRLTDSQLHGVLLFLRSMQRGPSVSLSPISLDGDRARGDSIFATHCSRCHGRYGEGDLGPAILNRGFLDAASNEFLYATISRGRSHTAMFGWAVQPRAGKKFLSQDIQDVIAFMRSAPRPDFLPPGPNQGTPANGSVLFRELCSECHGENGEGTKAPALNNQEFLGAATNGYILASITLGRRGTPMPSWGTGSPKHRQLNAAERRDIVAFIRSWQTGVIRSEVLRR